MCKNVAVYCNKVLVLLQYKFCCGRNRTIISLNFPIYFKLRNNIHFELCKSVYSFILYNYHTRNISPLSPITNIHCSQNTFACIACQLRFVLIKHDKIALFDFGQRISVPSQSPEASATITQHVYLTAGLHQPICYHSRDAGRFHRPAANRWTAKTTKSRHRGRLPALCCQIRACHHRRESR